MAVARGTHRRFQGKSKSLAYVGRMMTLRSAPGMRERAPNVWELVVQAGRDPVTGRSRQVSRTFRGNLREAKTPRAELIVEVTKGRHTGFGGVPDVPPGGTHRDCGTVGSVSDASPTFGALLRGPLLGRGWWLVGRSIRRALLDRTEWCRTRFRSVCGLSVSM